MPAYLGIDYGTKRIGLAWADELGIALPVGAISGIEIEGCWDQLAEEINSRKIDELVVGYPLHMDGKVGKRAEEVDQFIDRLSDLFLCPFTGWTNASRAWQPRNPSEKKPRPRKESRAERWMPRQRVSFCVISCRGNRLTSSHTLLSDA